MQSQSDILVSIGHFYLTTITQERQGVQGRRPQKEREREAKKGKIEKKKETITQKIRK